MIKKNFSQAKNSLLVLLLVISDGLPAAFGRQKSNYSENLFSFVIGNCAFGNRDSRVMNERQIQRLVFTVKNIRECINS